MSNNTTIYRLLHLDNTRGSTNTKSNFVHKFSFTSGAYQWQCVIFLSNGFFVFSSEEGLIHERHQCINTMIAPIEIVIQASCSTPALPGFLQCVSLLFFVLVNFVGITNTTQTETTITKFDLAGLMTRPKYIRLID